MIGRNTVQTHLAVLGVDHYHRFVRFCCQPIQHHVINTDNDDAVDIRLMKCLHKNSDIRFIDCQRAFTYVNIKTRNFRRYFLNHFIIITIFMGREGGGWRTEQQAIH
ncbi:hypothetical protein SRABI106_00203 [Rahnella aquatilis]|nr:hypothetical protein SRABI106_00203 [Rahnella aquatilis]